VRFKTEICGRDAGTGKRGEKMDYESLAEQEY
jgi:hypothetical protein